MQGTSPVPPSASKLAGVTTLFSTAPVAGPRVSSKFRRIVTDLPVPDSVPLLELITRYEPRTVHWQPPLIWDRAEGVAVYDPYGNKWLDWTSGVLVANVGHSHQTVCDAVAHHSDHGQLYSYAFPNRDRAILAQRIVELAPPELDGVLFFSTGSEAVEASLKISRLAAMSRGESARRCIVSFERAFHGRTMGAQLAGGFPKSKEWIPVNADAFIQVPFPDGFRCPDTTFDRFEETLRRNGIEPAHVAAVIMETYQGGGASFAPVPYVRALATWCQAAGAVLIFDEVQAGFGRTGTLFGFEHYGIVPDLVCLGKAISGALPLSALLGRRALLDIPGPGEVTSTHGGNPLVCASALANIDTLLNENLVERGRETGARLGAQLSALQLDFPDLIGAIHGRGLVYGIHVVQPGGITPNPSAALQIVDHCFRNGLLLFEPVGYGLGTVKICPPLCITADAVDDGCSVLREAFESLTSLAADATRPGRN